MKIKRLNIFGFKSFVDKTSLSFPRGITSVVGPNGCGKSNIVDAIRWVLGEQGAKSLRGKTMDDVIFNGSERRRPAGMAEVSLTFSNEDGLAPPGYEQHAEISIKRRLYRSGESEYYINNALCRLKDIVELFMDTGIGNRAYSIVEQGYVEWLINSKPEDRRSVIEEVAGIHKYKARKSAALRKLEATEQNLMRVKDIMTEVKRQMNSLKYQARKAKSYKTIKEKIKKIEFSLWAEEYSALKIQKESFEKDIEESKYREMESSTNLSHREDALEKVKLASLKKDDELKSARERVMEAEGVLKRIETDMEVSHLKLNNLRGESSNLKMDIEDLEGSKEKLEGEKRSLKETASSLARGIEEREEELKKKEKFLNTLLARLSPEQAALEEKKHTIIDVITEFTSRKNDISYIETAMGDLKGRIEKNRLDKEEIKNLLSSNDVDLRGLSKKLLEFKEKGGNLKKVLEEGIISLEGIKRDHLKKEEEFNILKDELSRKSSRLYSLKELDRNLEGFDNAVKSVMERDNRADIKVTGVHGVVADIIETQPRYERAVEAVLGERLQYVIVESQRAGLEAIQYLKSVESGRGGFIPVKVREKEVKTVTISAPPKAETHLLDCVKVKNGYTTVANHLLGDVVVVENIHSAIDLWGENGLDKTFVTLEGDIIDSWGVLRGGSLDNGKDPGILKRRREIKELFSLVKGLEQKQNELETERCELSNRLSEREQEIEKLKEEDHEREKEEIAWEKEYNRLEGEKTHLKSRQELLEIEMEEFSGDLCNLSARLKQCITEKEELEARKNQEEESLNLLEEKVKDITKEINSSNKTVTDLKVDLASCNEKREALYNASLKANEQLEDVERRLTSIKERIIISEEEGKGLISHIEGLKGSIEKALRDKDDLKMEMVKREEEYQGIIEEIKGMEEGVTEERRKLSGLDKNLSGLQLTFKELELNILHLKEKVTERYQEDIEAHLQLKTEDGLSKEDAQKRLVELRKRAESFGDVNLAATEELLELEDRYNFLSSQQDDLNMSVDGIHKAIGKINRITRKRFKDAFETINERFKEVYARFFEGGKAELRLTDESDLLESGVDIVAQPLGKRLQNITLLSGGEKALTALSLIFSIFLIKPSPFCLLDEADAPLDDANILRFNNMIKGISEHSQFILITHNKKTMEIADTLFGITMEESGISRLLSVRVTEEQMVALN